MAANLCHIFFFIDVIMLNGVENVYKEIGHNSLKVYYTNK